MHRESSVAGDDVENVAVGVAENGGGDVVADVVADGVADGDDVVVQGPPCH